MRTKKPNIADFSKTCRKLKQVFNAYDEPLGAIKFELLMQLSSFDTFQPRTLRDYHRILLFLEAFPDNHAIHRTAKQELLRLASRVPLLVRDDKRLDNELLDSGICGSRAHVSPGLVATKWLLSNCPDDITIDLENGPNEDGLDEFLRDLTGLPLSDAVLYNELSIKEVLHRISGSTYLSARWLTSIVSLSSDNSVLAEHTYKRLDFWLYWWLNKKFATTTVRLTKRSPYIHVDGLLKKFDIPKLIKKGIPEPAKISDTEKKYILDAAKAILYQQRRETDYVNYSTTSDFYLFELDRGVDIVFLGTEPSRRRYFESFFGFIATKNSIPCAYGGAWICGSKADIGFHIFDSFRGGESAHLIAQIMRCYHNYFGVDLFEVEPYQFGQNNEEGMQSGAFWFYWKMGFRSVSKKLNSLALNEAKKISSKKHKTSAATLKQLCAAKLRFSLGQEDSHSISVQELGVQVCNKVGKAYGGDIEFACRSEADHLVNKLELHPVLWSKAEKEALIQLSLPLSILLEHTKLTPQARKDLETLIKAKASPSEREYCLVLKHCARLFNLR